MSTWSFYDLETGIFTGQEFSGPERLLLKNTPPRCGAWPGQIDHVTKRVVSFQLVDYIPPPPDEDHLWTGRRYALKASARERNRKRANAQFQLKKIDAEKLPRVLMEFVMDPDKRGGSDNKTPRERLADIENEKATLRQELEDD